MADEQRTSDTREGDVRKGATKSTNNHEPTRGGPIFHLPLLSLSRFLVSRCRSPFHRVSSHVLPGRFERSTRLANACQQHDSGQGDIMDEGRTSGDQGDECKRRTSYDRREMTNDNADDTKP